MPVNTSAPRRSAGRRPGGRRRRCGPATRRRWWRRRGRRRAGGRRRRRPARGRGRARSGRPGRPGGSRRRRWRRPRPGPGGRRRRPSSSSTSPRSPFSSSAGWTWAPGGAWPSTTRSGSRPVDVADGERRVVGPDGAGADEHGVALGPQAVGVGPGLGAGDPLARPVGRGGAPVEGGGQLQHDVRPAGGAVLEVGGELAGDLVGARRRGRPRCRPPAGGDARARPRWGRGPRCRRRPGRCRRRRWRRRTAGAAVVGSTARAWRRGWRRGPRRRRRRRATISAWGPPGGSVAPLEHAPSPARPRTPTHGLGEVEVRTPAASSIGPAHGLARRRRGIEGMSGTRPAFVNARSRPAVECAHLSGVTGAPWGGRRGGRGRGGRCRGRRRGTRPRRRWSRGC